MKGPPQGGPEQISADAPYFFLPAGATVLFIPAVASTFGFSFLGFFASLLERI
jgi:hypothetical protein